MGKLAEEEHKKIHIELHKSLDELVADYITQTGKGITDSSILDLIQWSYKQTETPTFSESTENTK